MAIGWVCLALISICVSAGNQGGGGGRQVLVTTVENAEDNGGWQGPGVSIWKTREAAHKTRRGLMR